MSRVRAILYHSVVPRRDETNYYSAGALEASEFEAQAAELARHWAVLSLSEVMERLKAGKPFPRRAVNLSFDDGFQNNLVAAEVLARHRLPWTVFVVVDAVLDGYRPWYVRLADALAPARGPTKFEGDVFDLAIDASKRRLSNGLKARVLEMPAGEHQRVLSELLDACGLPEPQTSAWPFLSLRELSQLQSDGVEIGNHSARHPNLVRCDAAGLQQEIVYSKQRLDAALGSRPRFFAYPDGRYDSRVIAMVKTAHDGGLAGPQSQEPTSPWQLRRFGVGRSVGSLRSALSPAYPWLLPLLRLRLSAKRAVKAVVGRKP